jgi:hypothetical protein
MPSVQFTGETHGCYSDALQMCLGKQGPGESVLEVLTGSAFGMSVYRDGRPMFAPARWNPEIGLDLALELLGWTCEQGGGSREEAIAQLRRTTQDNPMLLGPVEMGLLPHHPGLGTAIGADHFLTVIGMEGDSVVMHDPRAHPWAVVPMDLVLAAWQSDTLSYTVPSYHYRHSFTREREVDVATAIHQLAGRAAAFIDPECGAAAEKAAEVMDSGLSTFQFFHLADFMVCVGSRRRGDAAILFEEHGYRAAAEILELQARLIGSMEYPLVSGDYASAATIMRKLAPTFEQLRLALLQAAKS